MKVRAAELISQLRGENGELKRKLNSQCYNLPYFVVIYRKAGDDQWGVDVCYDEQTALTLAEKLHTECGYEEVKALHARALATYSPSGMPDAGTTTTSKLPEARTTKDHT